MPGVALAVVVALVVAALASSGDDNKNKQKKGDTASAGPGEIFLEPTAAVGDDPFTQSTAAPTPSSSIPSTPITLGAPPSSGAPPPTAPQFTPSSGKSGGTLAITGRRGGTPGLYGGTRDQSSCEKQQLIDFLQANPTKARAWAEVQGITPAEIPDFVNGLTGVNLRSDTRVTNHGFARGRPTPRQSVLQAGTAVLVDQYGEPRVRCACGNPLLGPRAAPTTPSYEGKPWPGFTPTNVTVIVKNTTVINIITIIDIRTGDPFGRPVGPTGGTDRPLPPGGGGGTGTGAGGGGGAGGSGPFTLVTPIEKATVAELRNSWTVDEAAGTATVNLPPHRGDYFWTVPRQLDPAGTRIEWGGVSKGNINVLITPRGDGIKFDTTDLEVNVTDNEGRKSAVITVPTSIREVKLIFGMGFSVTATYTYRR